MPELGTPVEELETWENLSRSRHVLKKFSARGDLADEMIAGNKKFHVSIRERRINQELAASAQDDPFKNGRFSPVKLLDGSDDLDEIASNPNLLGESDMVGLVKGSVKALKERLAEVENTIVVRRLLEVAEAEDATIGKVKAIQARLDDLEPVLAAPVEGPRSNER